MDNLGWRKKIRAVFLLGPELTMVLAILAATALAQHEQAFPFDESNGWIPESELIADGFGNLYGTTSQGGLLTCNNGSGCGTVFKFTPPSVSGGQWTETTLYSFTGALDGGAPNGGLAIDTNGNLYGTTQFGGNGTNGCGAPGCGTVFELSPPREPGTPWTEAILYSFGLFIGDAEYPLATVILDLLGNVYGTTYNGGTGQFGGGTVFELSPPSQPGGVWTETIIYSFGQFLDDGGHPAAPLILDRVGNLYGTTQTGGSVAAGEGTAFQLAPPSQPGGLWTETILHNFGSRLKDGTNPTAALTLTPSGALIGTTATGGAGNSGVVFALSPPSNPGGAWGYGLPYIFTGGLDGGSPQSRLTILPGKNPVIYGTTRLGGAVNQGTVFQLTPPSSPGSPWTEAAVYNFTGGKDGGRPLAGVLLNGPALYGTTSWGGIKNANCPLGCGAAFRLTH